MKAYLFPGQGAQFTGMGKDLYDTDQAARGLFDQADELFGESLSQVMFEGSDEDLKQTRITQPAIFLHSMATLARSRDQFEPAMVAGHSLGEISALVAAEAMRFEDGFLLVRERAAAMQEACDEQPGTMAAILGMDDEMVEQICADIQDDIVIAANYNTPGQLVISGSVTGVARASAALTEAGARRVVPLKVAGAFHSPLMQTAADRLQAAIEQTAFSRPICPVYQNVTAKAVTDPEQIKSNLLRQLTAPVRWTQTLRQMLADGATQFIEVGGSGRVLSGMVKKLDRSLPTETL